MKKKYTKPYLFIEAFQLDTAVASCSGEGGMGLHYSYENCTLDEELPGYGYFGDSCEAPAYADPGQKICYNAPMFEITFMNS